MNETVTRNGSVTFRINETEALRLKDGAEKSGLNQSAYIRKCLDGEPIIKIYQPRELLREMSAIGNNINQIARAANHRHDLYGSDLEVLQNQVWTLQQMLYRFVGKADILCR